MTSKVKLNERSSEAQPVANIEVIQVNKGKPPLKGRCVRYGDE